MGLDRTCNFKGKSAGRLLQRGQYSQKNQKVTLVPSSSVQRYLEKWKTCLHLTMRTSEEEETTRSVISGKINQLNYWWSSNSHSHQQM